MQTDSLPSNMEEGNLLARLKGNRKAVLLVTLIFLSICVLLFLLLLVVKKEKNEKTSAEIPIAQISVTPSVTSFVVSFDSIEKATGEIEDYIRAQYRQDGYYDYISHYDQICSSSGKCPSVDRFYTTTNVWTALAYLGKYRTTGDESYLDLAIRDIDKLKVACEDGKTQCAWVLLQPAKVYQARPDPQILSFLKKEGEKLLTTSNPDNLMLLSIEVRELVALYQLTNDKRYFNEAKKRLETAKTRVSNETLSFSSDYGCWYTLSTLEISAITKDTKDENEIIDLLLQVDTDDNFSSFNTPMSIQPCIEALSFLATSKNSSKYQDMAVSLMEKFMDNFWDSQEKNLLFGEGGTLFLRSDRVENPAGNMVTLTDTAYTHYLLSLMKDYLLSLMKD